MTDYDAWYEELSNAVWVMLGENLEDSSIPAQAVVDAYDEGYTTEVAIDILYREYYEDYDEDDGDY